AVGSQQYIPWLQIAVHDVAQVGRVYGAGQRLDQAGRLRRTLRRAVELASQAASFHQLQGKVGPSVLLADFVDVDDIGVLEASDGFCFGAEAGQLLAPGMAAGQNQLESD